MARKAKTVETVEQVNTTIYSPEISAFIMAVLEAAVTLRDAIKASGEAVTPAAIVEVASVATAAIANAGMAEAIVAAKQEEGAAFLADITPVVPASLFTREMLRAAINARIEKDGGNPSEARTRLSPYLKISEVPEAEIGAVIARLEA